MANWHRSVIQFMLDLQETDPQLAKVILASIKHLERRPSLGVYVRETRYYYTDYEYRFRLGYNFHPDSHEIEIVVIHLLDPSIN